eukprot:COSAG03_NODE_1030_length_4991_cov_19.407604_6_plen_74_part_00
MFTGGGGGRVVPSEPDSREELEKLMETLGGEKPEHPHSPNGYNLLRIIIIHLISNMIRINMDVYIQILHYIII